MVWAVFQSDLTMAASASATGWGTGWAAAAGVLEGDAEEDSLVGVAAAPGAEAGAAEWFWGDTERGPERRAKTRTKGVKRSTGFFTSTV